MKFIYFIAILALTCSIGAQTVPESIHLKDDSSSLIQITEKQKLADEGEQGELVARTADAQRDDVPEIQKTADEGIQIQVEKTTRKAGAGDGTKNVKIYSPWPAKPMTPAPDGWMFSPAPSGVSAYRKEVVLGSGRPVALSITPFVLVPVSDGLNAIRIAEPGYDPVKQYNQQDTVGSMLKNATKELEYNEKQAAAAIRRLQLLLSSLPQQK
ncbi:MAG: hypothetical protein KJO21_08040 [Verrucomicrobiae bacterium]|nr:hypothetical protein [Verrucomicrobiae bacterium]NNJ43424.1 hypothetical protein [Akkermansiaceae bacterium]